MNSTYWGEIIALLTALSWSIGVFPFTEASRRMNPNAVNHFRMLLAMISLGILLMLLYRLNQKNYLRLLCHNIGFGLDYRVLLD
ncbi:MAG: EamA family transporter [Bacteroidetes bacterium]|nr:EamA family transporter [Bacteroidota bacterium]